MREEIFSTSCALLVTNGREDGLPTSLLTTIIFLVRRSVALL